MQPALHHVLDAPPEVLLGVVSYTKAMDIWPLGLALYELLTDEPLIELDAAAPS